VDLEACKKKFNEGDSAGWVAKDACLEHLTFRDFQCAGIDGLSWPDYRQHHRDWRSGFDSRLKPIHKTQVTDVV
jgi:hypothetical protein